MRAPSLVKSLPAEKKLLIYLPSSQLGKEGHPTWQPWKSQTALPRAGVILQQTRSIDSYLA